MAKPSAPGIRIRKWASGEWTDAPDAVVTEEPLQLLLNGRPLSVLMRTPGEDVELALGLMFAEGIARSIDEVRLVRVSAESCESSSAINVDGSIVEANQVDTTLGAAARREPARSMLWSSRVGVLGGW